jgi:hypothetical protein
LGKPRESSDEPRAEPTPKTDAFIAPSGTIAPSRRRSPAPRCNPSGSRNQHSQARGRVTPNRDRGLAGHLKRGETIAKSESDSFEDRLDYLASVGLVVDPEEHAAASGVIV